MPNVCDAALINKIDLILYLDLDTETVQKSILQVHPDMPVFSISAKTGEGIAGWVAWLAAKVRGK